MPRSRIAGPDFELSKTRYPLVPPDSAQRALASRLDTPLAAPCNVRGPITEFHGMTNSYRLPLLLRLLTCTLLTTQLHTPVRAGELEPFTSDGCSAFPDGTLEHNELWLDCCTAHDFAYWKGGTYAEREAADRELERCVASQGKPEIGKLMLAGVRVGGTPYLPTSFRWGYGWRYPRFYGALSDAERAQVEVASKTEFSATGN